MTREWVDIGPCPCDEECAQLGTDGYTPHARAQCRALINQLRRVLGVEPEGAHLSVKSNPHDFGTYYEVVCKYDDEDSAATEYAYKCESECPGTWDDEARKELAEAGYPVEQF